MKISELHVKKVGKGIFEEQTGNFNKTEYLAAMMVYAHNKKAKSNNLQYHHNIEGRTLGNKQRNEK